MIPERRRLTYALLVSLLIHALLLRLTFGSEGLWRPGFGFFWPDRRIEAPDLRVVLDQPQLTVPVPAVASVAEPTEQARIEQRVASSTAPAPSVLRASPQRRAAAIAPKVGGRAGAHPATAAESVEAVPQTPLSADRPGDKAEPSLPPPAVIAVAPTDEPTWSVPATPETPTTVVAAAPSAPKPETPVSSLRDTGEAARALIDEKPSARADESAKPDSSRSEEQAQAEQTEAAAPDAPRIEAAQPENARPEAEGQEAERRAAEAQEAAQVQAARAEAARAEAARAEAARAEAARAEAARVEAARAEAARAEAARAEAARAEAAGAEAARAEAARAEAAGAEAARAEAARAEAARAEAARAEAARAEAARAEAARAEAARAEAARAEAARTEAEQIENARREAARRAMGRQLDEEAARREAATASAGPSRLLPPPWSNARRYRLFGRTDPNAELILYVEAWARKIQLNMTFEMVRDAAKQPHTDPVVWVAVRSDGSVESITFALSSGVAALDEAIRRVVESQTPYPAFPPGLARQYDVIEIRRTWYFDVAIRLY